jgi:hypothetical protein
MAKVFHRNFEDFKGNDRGASEITREPGFSKNTKNVLLLSNSSISKRKGFRFKGIASGIGVGVHSFLDTQTGATTNDIVRVWYNILDGKYVMYVHPYTRAVISFTTTNTNATYSFYVDSNGDFIQDFKESGTSLTGYPANFGTGRDDIEDGADPFASPPVGYDAWYNVPGGGNDLICFQNVVRDMPVPSVAGIVDGALFTGGEATNLLTIPVDSGHTINAGDTIYFVQSGFTPPVYQRTVASTTSTSITIHGNPVKVSDDQRILSNIIHDFISPDYQPPTVEFPVVFTKIPSSLGYTTPSYVNQDGSLYLVASDSYPLKYDRGGSYRAGLPKPVPWNNTTSRIHPRGAAASTVTSPLASSGSGSITGTYNYAYTFVFTDSQGVTRESDITEIGSITVSSVSTISLRMISAHVTKIGAILGGSGGTSPYTVVYKDPDLKVGDIVYVSLGSGAWRKTTISAITSTTIGLTLGPALLANDVIYVVNEETRGYNCHYGVADGTQTNIELKDLDTLFGGEVSEGTGPPVAVLPNFFATENAYLLNRATGQYEFYRNLSATFPSPTVSVNDLDIISYGMKIAVYRTFNGGLDYYLVDEIPHNGGAPVNFYNDTKLDSQLGRKYIAPIRPPTPPPKASIISTHQGLQILVGGEDNPNTIFFSEPDNIESYPVATNSFDLPFTIQGPITGVASDQDVLIVFKERGRAIVRGELFSGNFNIEVLEDGIGCVAHASIVKTPVGIIFLSVQGFHRMAGGQIDFNFHNRTTRDFDDYSYIQKLGTEISAGDSLKPSLRRAVACNDFINYLYVCHIPTETGIPGHNKAENYGKGKWYCYDYSNDAWIDYTFADDDFSGANGMFMFEDKLHLAGKYVAVESDYETADDYADSTEPINMVLQDSWVGGSEPSILKKFLRLKLWSFAYEYFVGAMVTLKTYLDFNDSTAHTTATMDFTSSSTRERLIKLRAGQKARSLMVEFSNNTIHEAPVITGYELEIAPVFDKEIKE